MIDVKIVISVQVQDGQELGSASFLGNELLARIDSTTFVWEVFQAAIAKAQAAVKQGALG